MSFASGRRKLLIAAVLSLAALPLLRAQDANDLDNYRWRVAGNWWFSHPTGYFGLNGSNNYFDVNKDFGFGSYSTFTGKVDWHFAHKHHFLFMIGPNYNSKTDTLNRTITFQGQTFDIGAQVAASINSLD